VHRLVASRAPPASLISAAQKTILRVRRTTVPVARSRPGREARKNSTPTCGVECSFLGGLVVRIGALSVVGGVAHLADLGKGVEDGGAHALAQRHLGHAAALAAAAHVDEGHPLGDVEKIDVTAVRRHRRVDLLIEETLDALGDGIEPERVGVVDADRAHREIGVEGDAIEVGGGGKRDVDGNARKRIDDDVALPLLARSHQLHVVDEGAVLTAGDGDPQACGRLFAIRPHLLDAGAGRVGDADPGLLHAPESDASARSARYGRSRPWPTLLAMPPRVMLVLPTATYRATAFLRAADGLGLECVVASDEAPTLAALMKGRVLTLDLGHPEEAGVRAAAFAEQWPIDAIIGVDEASVLTAAHLATALGMGRNPIEAVGATRDKRRLRARLDEAFVRQPRWVEVRGDATGSAAGHAAAEVGLPCVVKPINLAASRGVIRADTAGELAAAVVRVDALLRRPELCGPDDDPPLLVEEFIPGAEIAIEGLLTEGELSVLAIFDKPDPLDGPFFAETLYVTPSRHDAATRDQAIALTREALRALGLRDGPIHAELRLADRGCVFLEVAARSIGGRCSSALAFVDGEREMSLEELILRHALRMSLDPPRLAPGGAGVLMLPVPISGVLRHVSGTGDAAAVPGVTSVELTIPLGQAMESLPEGDRYLGFVIARGPDAAAVEDALRRAQRLIGVDVETGATRSL
jgi:biotin carboxylase